MLRSLGADKYDRQYSDRYLLKRVLTYFQPYRRRVYAIAVLVIGFAITGAMFPLIIAVGVDALARQAPDSTIAIILGALLLTAMLDFVIFWLRRRLSGRVVADVVSQLRKDAFAAALNRDLGFYDENKSGKIVSRITSDTQELNTIILISLDIISQLFEFMILFFVLFSREWRLTLILFGAMPVVFGVTVLFRHFARIATRQGSRAMAAVNDNIQESVAGISVAKNFRQEGMIYDEFSTVNQESYQINLRRGFVLALIFPTLNALGGIAIATIVYFGGQFVLVGTISASAWYLFVQSIDRFWFPFINLSTFWSQLQQGFSAVERIFALVDAENTVNQTDNRPVPKLEGKVEFKDIVFEYNSGERVLDKFSLMIQPGESLAFVGHTGAGKSTIAKLIERFYEFQGGELLIDGHDIRSFEIHEYRSQLGIVPQQPFLFSGTVLDNIRYACQEVSDEEIKLLANSIGDGEWLETMPEGLNTEVGERGARLSMGQRQLVSLLRVLVQRPAIFILDEATASIDPFTETQIQEALDMILSRSTSILIAHRLSTVRSADRIVVLQQGKIIEQGSHEQLMEQGGHYAELYNTYFRHQSLSYVEHAKEMFAEETSGD
jgi:ATP-binding cassette subfamily B protein